MLRLADRMALYAYLRELGACNRARIVFEDDRSVFWDDLFFATQGTDPLVLDMLTLALEHMPENRHIDFLLDALLKVADAYVWSPERRSESFFRQYQSLRYGDRRGSYDDSDIPF